MGLFKDVLAIDNQEGMIKKLRALLTYTIVLMLVLELALRLIGYSIPEKIKHRSDQSTHETDPVLGWKLIPGTYTLAPFDPSDDSTQMTIEPEIGRTTRRPEAPYGKPKVLLVGGSFTLGTGLSDHQTFAWKLQERFKDLDFRNLGVGAYGSYQSLLVLESELLKPDIPKRVVYSLIGHHRLRNVAPADWLESIELHSHGVHPKTPYITLGHGGEMIREEGISMLKLPLSEYSVLALLTQRALMKVSSLKREREAKELSDLVFK